MNCASYRDCVHCESTENKYSPSQMCLAHRVCFKPCTPAAPDSCEDGHPSGTPNFRGALKEPCNTIQ